MSDPQRQRARAIAVPNGPQNGSNPAEGSSGSTIDSDSTSQSATTSIVSPAPPDRALAQSSHGKRRGHQPWCSDETPEGADRCPTCQSFSPRNSAATVVGTDSDEMWQRTAAVRDQLLRELLAAHGFTNPDAAPARIYVAAMSAADAVALRDAAFSAATAAGKSGKLRRRAIDAWVTTANKVDVTVETFAERIHHFRSHATWWPSQLIKSVEKLAKAVAKHADGEMRRRIAVDMRAILRDVNADPDAVDCETLRLRRDDIVDFILSDDVLRQQVLLRLRPPEQQPTVDDDDVDEMVL